MGQVRGWKAKRRLEQCRELALDPVHKPSQVNYNELELQFMSISSNLIG